MSLILAWLSSDKYLRPMHAAIHVSQQNSIKPVDADRGEKCLHISLHGNKIGMVMAI